MHKEDVNRRTKIRHLIKFIRDNLPRDFWLPREEMLLGKKEKKSTKRKSKETKIRQLNQIHKRELERRWFHVMLGKRVKVKGNKENKWQTAPTSSFQHSVNTYLKEVYVYVSSSKIPTDLKL